jgi:hypothetical protein
MVVVLVVEGIADDTLAHAPVPPQKGSIKETERLICMA